MIWLNKKSDDDRDFITCNMLVLACGKLGVLEDLKRELMDSSKYVLSSVDVIYNFGEIPFEYNNGSERIENQFVGCNDSDNIYVRRYYNNLRRYCLDILLQINLSKDEQMKFNIDLLKMLNDDLILIKVISDLYLYIQKDARYIVENLWREFHFFAKELLDVFELDEVCRYDLEDLRNIQKLCYKNNIQDNCSDILLYADIADKNSKVLSLAKSVNDKEKWYKKYS